MLYPQAGQPVLARHGLPRYDTPEDLAQVKGMVNGSLATLPGQRGGIYAYNQALQGRLLYQDNFSTFDGWTLDEATGAWAKTGELPTSSLLRAASISYGVVDLRWSGPRALKDLGQNVTNGMFAVPVNIVNNTVGQLSRLGIVLYDASMNALGAHILTDPSSTLAQTIAYQMGAGYLPDQNGTALSSNTISSTNPHTITGWLGILKVGSSWTFFWPGGSQTHTVSATAVRYIGLFMQGFRSSSTNWPMIATFDITGFAALKDPANAATLALAISTGGGGSSATLANAFDGNLATQFSSGRLGSENYGGGTYLGQQLAQATRYPRLAGVVVANGTTGAANANAPTSARILMADSSAGPWDVVANYDGLSTATGARNYLVLPVGLRGRRAWRVEPTAGIGAGALWLVGELEAYYGPAQPSPARQVPAYFADGTWDISIAAGGGGSALPAVLGW